MNGGLTLAEMDSRKSKAAAYDELVATYSRAPGMKGKCMHCGSSKRHHERKGLKCKTRLKDTRYEPWC